jgi:hypothetical protein
MSPRKDTQKSAKRTAANRNKSNGFTNEERAAMRERAQELKTDARRGPRGRKDKTDGEGDVLAKIAAMPKPDRAMAKRVHTIVQSAQKFKSRYATLGFSDTANLDDGAMWPTAFALKELTAAEEQRIVALVKKAVS